MFCFFHDNLSDKITGENKNDQQNEKDMKLKSFYMTMDTCHNHTDKGCGDGEGVQADAIKKSYSDVPGTFRKLFGERLSRLKGLTDAIKMSKKIS